MRLRNFSTLTSLLLVTLVAGFCGWLSVVNEIPHTEFIVFLLSFIAGGVLYTAFLEEASVLHGFKLLLSFMLFFMVGVIINGGEFKGIIFFDFIVSSFFSAFSFMVASLIAGVVKEYLERSESMPC